MQRYIDAFANFFRSLFGRPRHYRVKARTMKFRVPFLPALVLALAMTAPAFAQEVCPTQWADVAATAAERGFKVVELTEEQRGNAEKNWNSIEPVSAEVFDRAYAIRVPGPGIVMAFVQGPCVYHIEHVTMEIFEAFISPPGSRGS